MKNNIQILFTDSEIKELEAKAGDLNLSSYIRSVVLDSDEHGEAYTKLKEKVDNLPSGTKFNIKSLFGVEWTMSKGVKLNLGKTFFRNVGKGEIDNVVAVEKDSSNVQWYIKK